MTISPPNVVSSSTGHLIPPLYTTNVTSDQLLTPILVLFIKFYASRTLNRLPVAPSPELLSSIVTYYGYVNTTCELCCYMRQVAMIWSHQETVVTNERIRISLLRVARFKGGSMFFPSRVTPVPSITVIRWAELCESKTVTCFGGKV